MRTYYVIAEGQPEDRAVYYTGEESFHGGELWGNITEAYRFETMEDAFKVMSRYSTCTREIIVGISECTWAVIERGYNDFKNNIQSTDREVMHKYNTISYITNSR